MNKNVAISITGKHKNEFETSDITTNAIGKCVKKELNSKEKYYITYDELAENGEKQSSCILKIEAEIVEMIRKGGASTHMVFKKNEVCNTSLDTGAGRIMIGVDTKQVEIIKKDTSISVKLEYQLIMEENVVSHCDMDIKIEEK